MLEIVALSRDDGWALVREAKELLLVRPPYKRIDQRHVHEKYVTTAVSRLGFRHPEEPLEFSGWSALVAYLNRQVEAARAEAGQTITGLGLSESILTMAPAPVLRRFLERTRRELLPNPTAWSGAEQLLLVLLRLPQLRESSDLHEETVQLLDQLLDAKRGRERAIEQGTANLKIRFPRISQRMGIEELLAYQRAVARQPAPMGL